MTSKEKLEEIKKYINNLYEKYLYEKYKTDDKTNIENCEKCQQTQYNLGAFKILKDLKEILK